MAKAKEVEEAITAAGAAEEEAALAADAAKAKKAMRAKERLQEKRQARELAKAAANELKEVTQADVAEEVATLAEHTRATPPQGHPSLEPSIPRASHP